MRRCCRGEVNWSWSLCWRRSTRDRHAPARAQLTEVRQTRPESRLRLEPTPSRTGRSLASNSTLNPLPAAARDTIDQQREHGVISQWRPRVLISHLGYRLSSPLRCHSTTERFPLRSRWAPLAGAAGILLSGTLPTLEPAAWAGKLRSSSENQGNAASGIRVKSRSRNTRAEGDARVWPRSKASCPPISPIFPLPRPYSSTVIPKADNHGLTRPLRGRHLSPGKRLADAKPCIVRPLRWDRTVPDAKPHGALGCQGYAPFGSAVFCLGVLRRHRPEIDR